MKNIRDLRSELANLYCQFKGGLVNTSHAAGLNNTAGKIINTVKVELNYAMQRKEKPEIAFLH